VYQGDELGMTNYPFKGIEDFDDIAVKNAWRDSVVTKQVGVEDFLENMRKISRDNARTPMQWDGSRNGGFTTAAKSWLAVNPNFVEVNAKQSLADPNSIYHYYARMAELRRATPALVYGDYKDIDPGNAKVFAYTRAMGKSGYLIVLNFSRETVSYALPGGLKTGALVTSNIGGAEENTATLKMKPWEARVYTISVSSAGANGN
jgi:oligo-1,6-glucosidase